MDKNYRRLSLFYCKLRSYFLVCVTYVQVIYIKSDKFAAPYVYRHSRYVRKI